MGALQFFEISDFFGMEYHRFWNMGKIFLDTLSIENAPWPELRSYCPETFLYASPSFTSAHQQAASVRTQQFCFKLSHDEFFSGQVAHVGAVGTVTISCLPWSGLKFKGRQGQTVAYTSNFCRLQLQLFVACNSE